MRPTDGYWPPEELPDGVLQKVWLNATGAASHSICRSVWNLVVEYSGDGEGKRLDPDLFMNREATKAAVEAFWAQAESPIEQSADPSVMDRRYQKAMCERIYRSARAEMVKHATH